MLEELNLAEALLGLGQGPVTSEFPSRRLGQNYVFGFDLADHCPHLTADPETRQNKLPLVYRTAYLSEAAEFLEVIDQSRTYMV